VANDKFYWHPDYRLNRDDWVRHKDVYQARRSVIKGVDYLYAHEQEERGTNDKVSPDAIELRSRREDRTSFLNITRMIVDLWRSLFFRTPVDLDEGAKRLFDGAEKNIDGHGKTLDKFIRGDVLTNYLLYGDVWILTDAFGIQARSKGQESLLGLRPYWECIEPLGVPDWEYEEEDPKRIGKLNAFRTQYEAIARRANLGQAPTTEVRTDVYQVVGNGYVIQRYKATSTAAEVASKNIEDVQWESVNESVGAIIVPLDELPVARLREEDWVHDLVEENLRHYNLRSSADNIEYYQAYDKLVLFSERTGTEIAGGLTEHSIAFIKDKDARLEKIQSNDPKGIKESVQQSLDACFKIGLNQVRALPSDSRATQAADSMLEEKDNTIASVESSLQEIEDVLNESLGYFADFKGQKRSGKITVNKKISDRDWDHFRSQMLSMRDILMKVEGFDKAAAIEVIQSLEFPEETEKELIINAEKLKAIIEEESDPIDEALNGQ
jgi:hypothetical protein